MFEKYLNILSKKGSFAPWKGFKNWRPIYQISLFGSILETGSDLEKSNVKKMNGVLKHYEKLSWNILKYRYDLVFPLSMGKLHAKIHGEGFDFILYVPPPSYGRPVLATTREVNLDNIFNVLKLASGDSGVSRTQLAPIYSQSKFKMHADFHYHAKAQRQVLACTFGFLQKKLNFEGDESVWLDEFVGTPNEQRFAALFLREPWREHRTANSKAIEDENTKHQSRSSSSSTSLSPSD